MFEKDRRGGEMKGYRIKASKIDRIEQEVVTPEGVIAVRKWMTEFGYTIDSIEDVEIK